MGPGVFPLHPHSTISANDVTFKYAVTGERSDTVTAAAGGAYISTGFGNDRIIGGSGNDTIDGGENGDIMSGGAGSDLFIRQYADFSDTILDFQAGAGGDVLVLKGMGYTSFAQLNLRQVGANVLVDFGPGGVDTLNNVTLANLTAANFMFLTDTQPGQILALKATELFAVGTDRADTIIVGRDHLDATDFDVMGGTGFDTIKTSVTSLFGALENVGTYSGIDAFDLSDVATVAVSVGAQQVARSDSGNFYIRMGDTGSMLLNVGPLGAGKTVWVEGARALQLFGGTDHTLKSADRIGVHITGDIAKDILYTTTKADWVDGGAGNDFIFGGGGDDSIHGGTGADFMNGGPGSDIYYVDDLGDRVWESSAWLGTDTVVSSVDFRMGTSHIENLLLAGSAVVGVGNGLMNVITGNGAANILDGGKNFDTLIGGFGDDTYVLRAGDVAVEQANGGIDTVRAFAATTILGDNIENLYLQNVGPTVVMTAIGNVMDNSIIGNPFDNVLNGREGNDMLRGQAGADTFQFDSAPGAGNVDRILDFTPGDDHLQLKGSLFGLPATGTLAAGSFVLGTVAADANDRILYDKATGNLWVDLDGNGAGQAVLFAVLANHADLAAGDVLLF